MSGKPKTSDVIEQATEAAKAVKADMMERKRACETAIKTLLEEHNCTLAIAHRELYLPLGNKVNEQWDVEVLANKPKSGVPS